MNGNTLTLGLVGALALAGAVRQRSGSRATPPAGLKIYGYSEDDSDEDRSELAEAAWALALASPISILSDKSLAVIAVLNGVVVGAGWKAVSRGYGDEPATYDFDVVVAPEAQGKGVGEAVTDALLHDYREERAAYRDMDEELVLDVHVVNPAMQKLLQRKGLVREQERGKVYLRSKPRGSSNARSKAFGPRLPLGLGKLTYRVKRDTNDNLLIGVYDGATRIAHIDGYWEYSMRGAESRQEEVETRGRGIACAKDLRALGAEGKYPNLLAVHHAFLDDASRKGQGIGRAMYEALFREALNVRASRIGGSPGPLFVMPHACTSVGSTSDDALRVWQSLAKRYPSSGVVVRVDA